jgi:starch phosphorylase
MQQHCIGINGTFFNTHRMLGQYFSNAYFPQSNLEGAMLLDPDPLGKRAEPAEKAAMPEPALV